MMLAGASGARRRRGEPRTNPYAAKEIIEALPAEAEKYGIDKSG